ncbi:MAG: transposase [bacterium]
MARSRYKFFENEGPYFVTCTIVNWLPIFARPEAAGTVLKSWKFLQTEDRLTLFGYVILENHLHCIVSAENPSKEIGNFKSYTAREIIDSFKERNEQFLLKQLSAFKLSHRTDRPHQFWQEGSHPQLIQNDEIMRQKLEYIHYNPVRREYVDEPIHWRYSSARNYAELQGLLDVTTEW